ncbi:hypothetical protein Pint_19946 [Pistacia integerrima]|uniref:Uncharacterized protein n=1 Tax=Pistacia integerrima TaxID=434235 RepID=A0ACC0XBI5_9ROSI|nr:hypothetical protein Pint_19946 [Pistacia integerrima]
MLLGYDFRFQLYDGMELCRIHHTAAGTFFIFSVVNLANVIFIAKMVPETKGRTLEEIQSTISTSFL